MSALAGHTFLVIGHHNALRGFVTLTFDIGNSKWHRDLHLRKERTLTFLERLTLELQAELPVEPTHSQATAS